MLEPQSDQGWEKQLTCSCVGRQPLLTLGLGQLCGPCLWQGPREAGGQAAGTVVPLAGLPAPTPPTSFGFLVPTHAQPTASSLQTSVPHILAQPQDPAMPSGLVPCLSRLQDSGSPGRGDRDRNQSRCLEVKQNAETKRGQVGARMPGFEPLSNCVKTPSFVCASVFSSVGRIQISHRLVLRITVCKYM